jgi:Tol biopolymer transport system component
VGNINLKTRIIIFSFLILVLVIGWLPHEKQASQEDLPPLKGPYLGQKPPGMIPEIFAPGTVSTSYDECMAFFTPDGKEFYFMLWGAPHGVILFTKEVNNRWTNPQVASFSGKYHGKFSLSPDGNKIVFSSNRPLDGRGEPIDSYYSWIVERTDTGWSKPKNLGPQINLEKTYSAYPSLSKNGNLYFFSNREGGMGKADIWLSKFVDGRYSEPENLGKSINTKVYEVDPFIASDESYIIFCRRDDEFGRFDLFISFRKADGSWTKSKNMGEKINSSASEICPSVSPDGKYLFFASDRRKHKPFSEVPITYEEKIKILNSPGNGSYDIYWVDAKVIANLKPKEIK